MKKICFIAIALVLFDFIPVYAGQFGPAEAQVKPGEFSLGVGALRYSDEWNFKPTANMNDFTTDALQSQFYVQVEIGLFPTWEIYLRGGAADAHVDQVLGGSNFEDDYQPFATGGIKGLLRRGKYLDLGIFAEGSYFHEYTDSSPQVKNLIIDEAISVNAGLTFEKELEGALIYAGPFYHYRQGNFWFVAAPGSGMTSFHGIYEEDNPLGGFFGIRWTALKDIVVEGEFQLRNKLSAGGAVSFIF